MTTTIAELERALLDVVVRHEVRNVALTVDDFSSPYARQCWAAVIDLYAAAEAPSLRAVHARMLQRGSHRNDHDALRLIFLPLGHLADLEDLVAIVSENGRKARLRLDGGRTAGQAA